MTGREALLGTSFHLSQANEDGGPRFTAWGRVAAGGFEAEVDGVTMDGDVTTGLVGADVEGGRWLAGAALSLSEGEGSYARGADVVSAFGRGTVESTLASVYPYARLRLNERVSAWGLAGYGTGALTLTEKSGTDAKDERRYETDIGMTMGALLEAGEGGGFDLAVRSDAFWVRMTSDAVAGLEASRAGAGRVRLLLDGSRRFAVGEAAALVPRLEVGVRHDAGDAETGTGLEVGAGLRYEAAGVAVEGAVRGLVAHEQSGYEEWGASGSVRIDPDASGRGLSLRLAPSWGNASSGTERLWSAGDALALAPEGGFEAERRLDAEVGYGFSVLGGRAVVTPHAGWSRADDWAYPGSVDG